MASTIAIGAGVAVAAFLVRVPFQPATQLSQSRLDWTGLMFFFRAVLVSLPGVAHAAALVPSGKPSTKAGSNRA